MNCDLNFPRYVRIKEVHNSNQTWPVKTFNSIGVPFFGQERHDKITKIWEKPFLKKGVIDWNSILLLEEPTIIVLKIAEHLRKEDTVILIEDWQDLSCLSELLIIITKSKLNYHKTRIMLKMLSQQLMDSIIKLISDNFSAITREKVTVVDNLIIFYADVVLYFGHLLEHEDIFQSLKLLLITCENFYQRSSDIYLNGGILSKLSVMKTFKSHNLNSIKVIFPTNIRQKNMIYPNLKVGAFKSVTDYINTHFLLLKEEFESSLRTGVNNYLKNKPSEVTENNLIIYENVSLVITEYKKKQAYAVKFTKQKKQLNMTDWLNSTLFLYGSLILLTNNNFNTYFIAKVENREPLETKKGYLIISFLVFPNCIDWNAKYLLAEPTKYFVPFFSVMNILRLMPKYKFPFENYLVHGVNNVKPPSYLRENMIYKIGEHNVIVSKRDTYPEPETVGLNRYQLDSLYHALNNEISLIQGPPGTGKTFMCKKVIEVLLQNKHAWKNEFNTPILVICYKNLSLDELLLGLLKDKINVIRIGKRTKNKMLMTFHSINSIDDPSFCAIFKHYKTRLQKCHMERVKKEINQITRMSALIKDNRGVIPFKTLKTVLHDEDAEYLKNIYLNWIFDMQLENISSIKRHSSYEIKDFDINSFISKLKELPMINSENNKLHVNDLNKLCLRLNMLLKFKSNMEKFDKTELLMTNIKDITNLEDRWALYYLWLGKLQIKYRFQFKLLMEKYCNLESECVEISNILNSRKIGQSDVDVIGMTTTAGARLNVLLDELKPRIVIIEEAAEIIESHCVASLNEHCQHVILFGDHKQLRPCVNSDIGREYNLDLSLFERLINNGIKPSVLNIQYRMRPEISALITPAIYEHLQNDASVENKTDIKGITKNVFFLDHLNLERKGSKLSVYNIFEVKFSLSLARYFIMQGYEPSKITILATYSEQETILNKNLETLVKQNKKKSQHLNNIVIATVDSYQGKENDIVILSLVRNNKRNQIGFLKLENRICVALSRAKMGLYILGNMAMLTNSSKLWQEVNVVLQKQNAIGKKLPLTCPQSRAICFGLSLISHTECNVLSKKKLKCGHRLKNHSENAKHNKMHKCTELCLASLKCGHKCQFMCHTDDKKHENKFSCPLCNEDKEQELYNFNNTENKGENNLCLTKLLHDLCSLHCHESSSHADEHSLPDELP